MKVLKTNNLFDLIDRIKERPGMFLNPVDVSSLDIYLSGYQTALMIHNLKETIFPFWFFHEWVAFHYGWTSSVAGWKNILLKENNNEKEKSFEIFFQLFEEFKNIHSITIQKAKITEENLQFHYSEQCKSKRLTGASLNEKEPIYKQASEIYFAELSHNFGYIYWVINNETVEINNGISKNEQDIIQIITSLFGEVQWEKVDNKDFIEIITQ